ncbi:MAG: biotin synthase BioB [Clostridiales bacterium]|nr:biotin synthase BioB [Clostridiales bacterium]
MKQEIFLRKQLASEIIKGRRLTRQDDLSVFQHADLSELCEGADAIRKALCGDRIDLCTIINGRAGRCSENCKFCAQSSFSDTDCEKHGMLDTAAILADCKEREASGVHAYSIVTAGRTVEGKELDQLIAAYAALRRECNIRCCASHGFLSADALRRLIHAGVSIYHENIETSRRYFPNICTTHTYDDKIAEIRMAQKAGFTVCSGGIIGMGETFEDRVDMAVSLSELGIESIPLNALIPVKGTPLEDLAPLTKDEILRTAAMFRYLNPTAYIRMAAGRNYFEDGGRDLFKSGVNATITGDMLTTVGNNTNQDIAMLKELGFDLSKHEKREIEYEI